MHGIEESVTRQTDRQLLNGIIMKSLLTSPNTGILYDDDFCYRRDEENGQIWCDLKQV